MQSLGPGQLNDTIKLGELDRSFRYFVCHRSYVGVRQSLSTGVFSII